MCDDGIRLTPGVPPKNTVPIDMKGLTLSLILGGEAVYSPRMRTYQTLFRNVSNLFFFLRQLLGYAVTFVWALACPRAVLATRLLAVEGQLAACRERVRQKKDPRPRFTLAFRLLWIILSKLLDRWEHLAQLMQPATVKRWQTQAFRFYWRRKSRPGRPTISKEMQSLIRKMSRENPLWSAERIHDTLLLLGINPPCEDTIRKYMIKPRKPRNRSTTWLPFLRNHFDVSWAMDFFTVTTIGFSTLYVFLIFDHGRRKVMHLAVTPTPSISRRVVICSDVIFLVYNPLQRSGRHRHPPILTPLLNR